MGEWETAAVQGSDDQQSKVPFFSLLFICLLCTYIIFSHLILHLIVKRLTVLMFL